MSGIFKTAAASTSGSGRKETMKSSAKFALVGVIALSVTLFVLASGLFFTPVPIEQREDKTVYTPSLNVMLNATTFNGNIEIQSTTGDQIELIYNLKATRGEFSTIKTQTDEIKNGDQTTLITKAESSVYGASNNCADLLIKLPLSSQYNLTLISGNGNIIVPKLNLNRVSLNRVSVSTTNGNIDIKDDGVYASIEAISMNGNVRIGLAKDTSFQVAAIVVSGSIEHPGIMLDTEIETATRLKGTTSTGEGTLALTLMAVNGKITMEYL